MSVLSKHQNNCMKFLSILPLLLLAIGGRSQNTSFTVSMAGISDIRVGMKKAALEKLLNQTLSTPHLLKKDNDYYQDTVQVNYKGIDLEVMFQREYSEKNAFEIVVWEVRSTSPLLKTKSGISIGDDKLKIVSTYNDYTIHIFPQYENNNTVKSKTRSVVWLFGEESNKVIVFYLTDNKVTGFSVLYSEGC